MDRNEPNPEHDRRVFKATLLSALVLIAYTWFAPVPPPPTQGEPASPLTSATDATGIDSAPLASDSLLEANSEGDDDDSADSSESSSAMAMSSRVVRQPLVKDEVDWTGFATNWSNRGASPTSVRVEAYQEAYEQQWIPTWLLSGFTNGFEWEPFSMACPEGQAVNIINDDAGVVLPVGVDEDGIDADLATYEKLSTADPKVLSYRSRRGDIEINKTYSLPDVGSVSSYTVRITNRGSIAKQVSPSFGVADQILPQEGGIYANLSETWADVDGDLEHYPAEKLDDKDRDFEGSVSWFGIGERYFLVGLEPEIPLDGDIVMRKSTIGEHRYAVELRTDTVTLMPGETRAFKFKLWMGPRSLDAFQEADLAMASAVDFGMFGVLALPILAFLKFLNSILGVWGLAIILLTVCIKLALFPLSQKSYKSMKGMQKLQPEINALKDKHGDDREALNKEMMELWKKHGVNPMGGCLPMLIQMPIWFALYRVLWNSVELYQQPFLYFCDLSLRDPLGVFPLVLGLTMWLQQKFTPNTATDPTQQMVMRFMPIMFSVFMFTLPAGLVVYILVNNVLSIAQQWVIHRQNDDGEPKKQEN